MNIVSLFNGISCGRVACERAGIDVDKYYSSEVDKFAIQIDESNYPSNIQVGDVTTWKEWDIDWSSIDLLLGGSPCQGFSFLGKKLNLDDDRSKLFLTYADILNHIRSVNPNVKFILENVKMAKQPLEFISSTLGVDPILINSKLLSGQNRNRWYWTNIQGVKQPEDLNITMQSILEDGIPENANITPARLRWLTSEKGQLTVSKGYAKIDPEKAQCLTARSDGSWNSNYVTRQGKLTRLTPIEYERLQTLPDDFTSVVSNVQRYKSLGNGWTVDVIAHILSEIVAGEKQ